MENKTYWVCLGYFYTSVFSKALLFTPYCGVVSLFLLLKESKLLCATVESGVSWGVKSPFHPWEVILIYNYKSILSAGGCSSTFLQSIVVQCWHRHYFSMEIVLFCTWETDREAVHAHHEEFVTGESFISQTYCLKLVCVLLWVEWPRPWC